MSDFNGRIGEIVYAFEKDARLSDRRYIIRKVLEAERADGWKAGYSDCSEDQAADLLAECRLRRQAESDLAADLLAECRLRRQAESDLAEARQEAERLRELLATAGIVSEVPGA